MTLIQCACGCGEWIEDEDKRGKSRRFVNGHQARGKNNPIYDKIKEQNPFFGKHHSEKTRKNWSEMRKGKRACMGKLLTIPKLDDRNWLYQKYWIEKLSIKYIADEADCSEFAVTEAIKRMNIEHRPAGESMKGSNNPNYGKPLSEDHKRAISKQFNGKPKSEETRKRISEGKMGEKNPNYGIHFSEARRREMSEIRKGKRMGNDNPMYGKKHTKESRKKMSIKRSELAKKFWRDPIWIKKVMDGLHAKPNKFERAIDTILQKCFPNEWKYNGDFSCGITIGGMIPDFVNINGKKEVIEGFGEVWHSDNTFLDKIDWKRTEFGRKAMYTQYGYKCFIIWQYTNESKRYDDEFFKILTERVKSELNR